MRFGFMSEGETKESRSYLHRYRELIEEVQLAEQVGFDLFLASEQHFTFGGTISAPECLFSYLFAKTTSLRFRHAVMLLPHKINHPLRVAERIATEDILSNGRIELGTGRANTNLIVSGFDIDPEKSRAEWLESIRIIRRSFAEQPFSYEGEFLEIPKRYMLPLPIQRPHPPMSVAATSPESLRLAVEEELGVMTSSYFFGWPWFETLSEAYHEALDEKLGSTKEADSWEPHFSPLLYSFCAETDEEARKVGGESIYRAARLASIAFGRLAQKSQSYGYMAQADEIAEKIQDISWLVEESGTVVCGSPETCIEQIQRYVDMGANEIIIRIDGNEHEDTMRSIELFGKYVLPAFKPELAQVPEGVVEGGMT